MKTRVIHGFRNHDINKFVTWNFVHQNWFWLTGFVGANLFQNAFTNWCLLSTILEKLGLKDEKDTYCN